MNDWWKNKDTQPMLHYQDLLDTYNKCMTNPDPTITKWQKTFNFTCKKCNAKQIVYASGFGLVDTFDFVCKTGCGAQYQYNNSTKRTVWLNPVSSATPKTATQIKIDQAKVLNASWQRAQASYFAGAAFNTNRFVPKPKPKSLAEGYYIVEMNASDIAKLGPWEYEYHLKSEGIELNLNTKRFEKDGIITFLQLPIDFGIWTLYQKENENAMKAVTSQNYVGIYLSWCCKNDIAPLRHDILKEFFETCINDSDYALILDLIMTSNLRNPKDLNEAILQKLKVRLELFSRVPSGTNMLLAYALIEDITLKMFEESKISSDDNTIKLVEKFDKCKSLALGTKYIPEREVAFKQSLKIFQKITKVELT